MSNTLKQLRSMAARLHRDEGGAEGLEKLLILAAVVLPLLGLLIWFRNEIKDWVKDMWDAERSDAEDWDPSTD